MLAIIPARGGSKGLPGKNIKLLNGKPMIAYTIEAALEAKKVHRTVVSTDCEHIAKIAKEYGAEVPFLRPPSLAEDTSKAIDAFRYTIEQLEVMGDKIDEFIVLQPTSPLRTAQHIDEAIAIYHDKNATSVISFCEEDHPIFWHKYITSEGKFEEIFEGDYLKNRQEIRKTYRPNGAIYVYDRSILENGLYYTKETYAYIMNKRDSIDIDTIEDFLFAELLINKKNKKNEVLY